LEDAKARLHAYTHAAQSIESAFRAIEYCAPKPKPVEWGKSVKFRFAEESVHAAIFLKLARLSSLLNSLLYLVNEGRIQEQCIIQRAIEETEEDLNFLSLAVCGDGLTERHNTYLTEFWKEDYSDPSDPVGSRLPRAHSRRGIRSFINRAQGQPTPHIADEIGRSIYEMYSGFLHGAAPHILDLFNPENGTFHLDGMGRTLIHIDYIHDAQNSYYRGMLATAMAVKAFGLKDVLLTFTENLRKFEAAIGIENLQKPLN
jgi:hypothetical protein